MLFRSIDAWRVRYYKSQTDHELSADSLRNLIPLSSSDYEREYGKKHLDNLDKLKAAAGIRVDTKAPKNSHTESLRIAAGIL